MTCHRTTLLAFSLLLSAPGFAQAPATTQNPAPDASASAMMENRDQHIHPGMEVAFRVKLDHPLPEHAGVNGFLASGALNQTLNLVTSEVPDKDHREYILKATLPGSAAAGEWSLAAVSIFFEGPGGNGYSRISFNPVSFTVEGHPVDFPKTATVTMEHGNVK